MVKAKPKEKAAPKPKATEDAKPVDRPLVVMRIGANREIKQMGYLRAKLTEGNDVAVEASGRRISQAAIVIGPLLCEDRFRIPGLYIVDMTFRRHETEEGKGFYVARWHLSIKPV